FNGAAARMRRKQITAASEPGPLGLLQWSRRTNAAETAPANRQPARVRACFNGAAARMRRKRSRSFAAPVTPARLQWSRRTNAAETVSQRPQLKNIDSNASMEPPHEC